MNPAPVDPLVRVASPVREQVLAGIREAILDFRFQPGQRLVERELVEMFGVSRTTVREALGELKSEGLVTMVPQRGATVSIPDMAEASDLYDIRFRLEALVVERFVERASRDDISRFREAVEDLAGAVDNAAGVYELLTKRDEIFAILWDGANSPTLRQITETIQARLNILRAASISNEERLQGSVREWRDIAAAIEARDVDLAVDTFSQHLQRAAAVALRSLERFGDRTATVPEMFLEAAGISQETSESTAEA